MDNDVKVNVMPVDLAIQRELAYREKIAKLQTDGDVDFMKGLLPLQVQSCNDSCSQNLRPMLPQQQISFPSPNSSLVQGPLSSPVSRPFPETKLTPISSSSLPTMPSLAPMQEACWASAPPPNWNQFPASNTSLVPRPSHSGIKRKAATGNVQYPPPRYPRPSSNSFVSVDQFGNFFCKACQVSCTGASTLKQHLKGHKHKAKLQFLAMDKIAGEAKGTTTTTMCNLCRIWCSDENALELHLKGQKHRAKVQELELGQGQGLAREIAVERPFCELCGVWCTDENSFELHLKGQKHRAKVQESESGQGTGRKKAIERLFCEVCQIWCMNENALQQHLKGQKHVAKLNDVRKKNKGKWQISCSFRSSN